MKFSHLAETLQGSPILAISNTVKQRIHSGEKIYNLTVGDFDPGLFPIPHLLKTLVKAFYDNNCTNYPDAQGDLHLRESICSFTKSAQDIEYTPDEVLVGSGGRPLIYALYKSLIDQGDKVIYPVPGWNNQFYAQLTGAKVVEIQTIAGNHFMPRAEDFNQYIKDAVLIALCSPQNPTGTCFRKEELSAICEMVIAENNRRKDDEKKLYVLYDQMYHLITHGDNQHIDPVSLFPEMKDYTIYIDAISKSFAATGVRVGWAMGPAPLINKMKGLLMHVGAWAPLPEQKAVAAFLQDIPAVWDFLLTSKRAIYERLELFYEGILQMRLDDLPVDAISPEAGIYLSIRIDIPDAHHWLLEEAGIAILPFYVFGAKENNWYRISVGTCRKDDIEIIVEKMRFAITRRHNAFLKKQAVHTK